VESTIKKYGDKAAGVVTDLGYNDVGNISNLVERLAGDPLREF